MALHLVQVWAISAVIMLLDKGSLNFKFRRLRGTYRALTKVFTRFGVEVDFVDTTHIENVEKYIKPETVIYRNTFKSTFTCH